MISIVSPVYNSTDCIIPLIKKISSTLKQITRNYEIILVDDCSEDDSWKKIKRIKKKYKFIKGIKLKRNFGQHTAIFEGVKKTKFNIVIILDCDLQDNPSYILDLYKEYKRTKMPIIIKHSYKKFSYKNRLVSNIFWLLLSLVSMKRFSPNLGNFLLIHGKAKKEYLKINSIGYLYGDLISVGIKFIEIRKNRHLSKRKKGTTYNLKKLFALAFKLIVKYNIISQIFVKKKKYSLINKVEEVI